jgi:SAM-dependent methyltransferase
MSGSPDASPFAGTARYYDRFRAPYAPAAFDYIIETLGLDGSARVLDLGCGPGRVAIPLSHAVAEVVAVDPDADMIAEGRRLAGKQRNIRWLRSAAEDVSPAAGPFRAATIGQAFHWMDRDQVLAKLGILIEDGGGLALVSPGRRRPQESWEPVAGRMVAKFLGSRTPHPQSNPHEPQDEPALRRSEWFSDFTAHEFPGAVTRDINSIIGWVYSISSSARPLFGDAAEAFEAELSTALLSLNPAGVFHERLETEVVIALRKAR